jgi:tol-pal system protein YbgF
LVTKNYKTALDIIETVKNKDEQLKDAYQKIAYYRGVELYNDRDYNEAIVLFSKSLQYTADRSIAAQSLYLTAEAYYQLNNWDKAADYYEQFSTAKGASQSPGYLYVNYNLGYCLFKQKQYTQANAYFKRFVQDKRIKDNRSLSDAYIRSADCYLMSKNFSESIRNYDEALQLRAASPEYVYLQKAMAMGARGDLKQKVQSLQQIIDRYPQSAYSDQARYEIGNAYLLQKDDTKALEAFNEVITRYPKSPMAAKSMLKSGLIFYNNDQNSQAVDMLKMLISKYNNTQEAHEALATLKNIYVDMNRVDDFVAYSSKFQQGNISATEQDSLLYVAAESQYLKGNCEEAIRGFNSYLKQFPAGSFAVKASWYKADCESKSGDSKSALEDYERIISLPSSANYDKALAGAAAITYKQKQYSTALDYYTKLEESTADKSLRNDAFIGQMRCNYKLNNFGLAAQAAQRIGNNADNNSNVVSESNLVIGVAALKMNNLPLAKRSLEKVITDQGALGAEANFYLAQLNYNQQKYKEAEKIILNLQTKYASNDYWVAKGFVLLSDVYVQLGNAFQAKVTLQSVIENYKGEDDVLPSAKEKLNQLDSSKTTTK